MYGDGVVCDGLLLAGERKSIAPIAARLAQDPSEVEAIRQRLQQAVVVADWEDDILRRRMSLQLQKELGDLEALIGDDTGLPKHGMPSVGTARQYSGTLGRMDRCQVVPSLHAAGPSGSFCVGAQLYMPQSWMDDPVRLHKVGVPESIAFATKWQIMLGLLDRARSGGVRKLPFISDAGYGDVAEFRRELNGRTHEYLLEVMCTTAVWAPGTGPEPPLGRQPGRMGRPQTQYRDGEHVPLSVAELALSQTEDALQSVSWRNGDGPVRHSRFGALRVQPASGHCHGLAPEPEQWLLWEWVEGAELPEHYWLSTLPEDTPLLRLVYLAKLRWRVERDYQEMKAEVGLDHYEGRTWRGLHYHLSLCAIAHGFLVLQRVRWQRQQKVEAATAQAPPNPSRRVKKRSIRQSPVPARRAAAPAQRPTCEPRQLMSATTASLVSPAHPQPSPTRGHGIPASCATAELRRPQAQRSPLPPILSAAPRPAQTPGPRSRLSACPLP